jgi:subtilisin family serine protease
VLESSFTSETVKEKTVPIAPSVAIPSAARSEAGELRPVSIIVTFDESVDARTLEAVSGGQVIHRYKYVFNGASLILPGNKVDTVASLKGVTGIYLDELLDIDTDRSPRFIGANVTWKELGGQKSAGEGVVVGVLDTGIWPEHPSFADPDPFGNPYPAPPVVPGSNGFGAGGPRDTCDFGDTAYNPDDAPFTCNNKLIGAYDFLDTYKVLIGLLSGEFDSARDAEGHGTHTASTAAGNGGVEASIFGIPRGTISGIAPRAHVIMYKVCGDVGCYASDSASAVEQAILDEVDSINFSIGGGGSPYSDVVSLAFLAAYDNGVFVAASAGNSGPGADTTGHREPWVTTVGASTTDRHFISTVSVEADNGDTLTLEGASVTDGIGTPTSVIFPPAGEELCLTPFAPGTFSGEIVICRRGAIARVAKSFNVAAGGAGGLLLYNPVLQGLATDNHFIPSVHLENDAGTALLDFMATHTGVMATFTQGEATTVQGDVMAAFSSRGGPGQTLGVSKPDVTAPGVQILAGHSPLPATVIGGLPGELFQSIQGTSMSSPHVAGAAALLKDLHPDWTPGQIKSALMTTAKTRRVYKEDGVTKADPFDMGSGRINLNMAYDPGFTISASAQDFEDHQYDLWNANLPSVFVPDMPGQITVYRTIHSVLDFDHHYSMHVIEPRDIEITLLKSDGTPSDGFIDVDAFGDATFGITIDARKVPYGEVRHATVMLSDSHGDSRIPVTIVRGQGPVTIDKSCDPEVFKWKGGSTSCTITIQNTSFDDATVALSDEIPWGLDLVPGSVVGATAGDDYLEWSGTLFGAAPPIVNVAVDPLASPAGYLSLALFGGTTDVGATDESIANFTVPSFEYAGQVYSRIGIVSNGYIIVGGGTGADVNFINTDLPDPAVPNNVLAPFWTDLNPAFGGRVLINVLGDGANTWIVVEWESVRSFGDVETTTTQVWIGLNTDADPGEDISFVYGLDVSDGDGGFLTVGAENEYGNEGDTVYFDGVGTPPSPSFPNGNFEVDVFSTPGVPGETHVITFDMTAWNRGKWMNCAEMTGDLWQGVAIDCARGRVK